MMQMNKHFILSYLFLPRRFIDRFNSIYEFIIFGLYLWLLISISMLLLVLLLQLVEYLLMGRTKRIQFKELFVNVSVFPNCHFLTVRRDREFFLKHLKKISLIFLYLFSAFHHILDKNKVGSWFKSDGYFEFSFGCDLGIPYNWYVQRNGWKYKRTVWCFLWGALPFGLVFISSWNKTNACDYIVEHSTTYKHSRLCKHHVHARSIENSMFGRIFDYESNFNLLIVFFPFNFRLFEQDSPILQCFVESICRYFFYQISC